MSVRTLILLILAVPALVLGGAMAMGIAIPVPEWGRDYVLRSLLDPEVEPLDLPEILGPDDPTAPWW